MKRKIVYVFLLCVFMTGGTGFRWRKEAPALEDCTMQSRAAHIRPDYTGTVIPWNIAPLNFDIKEPGKQYFVRIYSENGLAIKISSKKSRIIIPLKKWHRLLSANRGKLLFFDIYVREKDNSWKRYQTLTNTIAKEDIDGYLVYRYMQPIYNFWRDIGIYQRNLENYDKSVVLQGKSFGHGCLNCHTFLNNRPDSMLISIRSNVYGSSVILARDGQVNKIGTKFGYSAWHPSGRLVTYSLNKVIQFFHTARAESRDVLDLASAIAYYKVDSKTAKTIPPLSNKKRLESYPTWSPDGRYLYFCRGEVLWPDFNSIPPERYDEVKYDLMRISYDVETDEWSELETVLSAEETGLSIMLPRISPDGRFLLFCMCEYGCFPIYQANSDLYIMELKTGKYRKLQINSEWSESWHSWSKNSRWIAFSSKRRGGMFTRTYFSYVDEAGKVYKPFILPQKDPVFYDSLLKTYSVPELITAAVPVGQKKLARAVRSAEKIAVEMPVTSATPKAPGSGVLLPERE